MVDPADPKKPSTAPDARLCPDDAFHDFLLEFFKDVRDGEEIARRMGQVAASSNTWVGKHFVPSDPPPITVAAITSLVQRHFVDIARHLLNVDFPATTGDGGKDPIKAASPRLQSLLKGLAMFDLDNPSDAKVFPEIRFIQETEESEAEEKRLHLSSMLEAFKRLENKDATAKSNDAGDALDKFRSTLPFTIIGEVNQDAAAWAAAPPSGTTEDMEGAPAVDGNEVDIEDDDSDGFETVSEGDEEEGGEEATTSALLELHWLCINCVHVSTPADCVLHHLDNALYKTTCSVHLTQSMMWPWLGRFVRLLPGILTPATGIPCPYTAEWELYRHGIMHIDLKESHVEVKMLRYGKLDSLPSK